MRPRLSRRIAASPPSSTPLMMAQERELARQAQGIARPFVKNADNVGEQFPNEARKMHYGDIEHRPIYGEASAEEAKSLIDEGVEVDAAAGAAGRPELIG